MKRKLTAEERAEIERRALARATTGQSTANYATILQEFAERGIPMAEIEPRVNVFTFVGWRALGRSVRKGEKGVKISVWVPSNRTERDLSTGETVERESSYCTTAHVFHLSQTTELKDFKKSGQSTPEFCGEAANLPPAPAPIAVESDAEYTARNAAFYAPVETQKTTESNTENPSLFTL